MDAVAAQAISSLESDLQSFISGIGQPGQRVSFSLIPTQIRPTGIGAYVGIHSDPVGAIVGRKINAIVEIEATAIPEDIDSLILLLSQTLLSQERATLREKGFFQLDMAEIKAPTMITEDSTVMTRRGINFEVLYEFIKLPEAAGGIIAEIPLDVELNIQSQSSRILLNRDFNEDWESDFTVVDDPRAGISAPSNWQFNAALSRMEQTSAIRGGGLTSTRITAGTYLLINPTGQVPPVQNFIFETEFEASSIDGVGMVFRYLDADNFYFTIMSNRHQFVRIGKKFQGTFEFLQSGGFVERPVYEPGVIYDLKLIAHEDTFTVYLDEELLVSGTDSDIRNKGRLGLMCHGSNDVGFNRLEIIEFI